MQQISALVIFEIIHASRSDDAAHRSASPPSAEVRSAWARVGGMSVPTTVCNSGARVGFY